MAPNAEDPMVQNRSMLKDFIASVATVSGDLSNITAPPFVLDTKSTVEIPSYWAENTTLFCSPATSEDAAERALLMLRSFLAGIKSQCYMGRDEDEGLKKPLNAFLGELSLPRWEDDNGTTIMVSEQVSHHPPITACRIWNDKHGISADSFNRSSISLGTSVHVESTGVVLKTITKYDEHYLLPIPNFNVKGLLSTPGPSLTGTYYITSTGGYTSVVRFTEKSMFGSKSKHSFEACLYKEADGEDHPLYSIKGSWNDEFVIHDETKKQDIETFNVQEKAIDTATTATIEPLDQQDSWESSKAWEAVKSALNKGDMQGASTAKDELENGQRDMRKDEETSGKTWEPLFFEQSTHNRIIESLAAKIPKDDERDVIVKGETVWTFNEKKWKETKKPYHFPLRPDNTHVENGQSKSQQQAKEQSKPGGVDEKVGAVEDGRPAEVDGLKVDVGQEPKKTHLEGITKDEPGPQAAQTGTREEYVGSGIEGMSLQEKRAVEDMLRDQYASAGAKKQSKKKE